MGLKCLLSLFILTLILLTPLVTQAQTYKILPLGNSITEGKVENPGYRYPLYDKLKDANIDFTYIGSLPEDFAWTGDVQHCTESPRIVPPLLHEGHGGWRADQILSGRPNSDPGKLSEWLQSYTPDVVLMHLGSNDMFQYQSAASTIDELREIVRLLRQDNPRVIILMAKLIPAHSPTVGEKANNIPLLNKEIPGLVQELHTSQSPVILVDQESGFNPAPGEDTFDGIHTNRRGAIKMADKWMQALRGVLSPSTQLPSVSMSSPTNNSQHSLGQPVKISANASDPEGAVRLVEFFANCTNIGEDATAPYEINWNPVSVGDYKLEARVTDAAGARAYAQPVVVKVSENTRTDYTTEQPQLYKPQQNSSSSREIAVDFYLPEAAKAGTLKLTFTRTGGSTDWHAPHTITFSSDLEASGRHTLTLNGNDLSTGSSISSVSSSPNDALVSNATYTVAVSYQDKLGNAAASDTKTGFTYNTSPPATPQKPVLAANSDTGVSNADGITSDATPELSGTAEVGSTISVYINESLFATSATEANGRWSYIVPAAKALADGNYQIKVTAVDGAGNSSAASEALVMVVDRQAPVVLVKDAAPALDVNGSATITVADVDGGSSDNASPANKLDLSLSRSSFSCDDLGKSQEVSLSATDQAGNKSTAIARVRVKDALAPGLQVQNVSLPLGADGTATLTEAAAVVSKTDNCSTPSISFSRTSFSCADAGKTINVTVVAADVSGNKREKTIKVSVEDKTAPAARVKDITVALGANGEATITAADIDGGSSDDCGNISLSLSKSRFSCADLGAHEVVLTVKDASGNSASAKATVLVEDKTAPELTVKDVNLSLDEQGKATLREELAVVSKSDNCGTPAISFSRTHFSCEDAGKTVAVTVTAQDARGNTLQKNIAVSVSDATAPVVKTKDIQVQLDSNGQAVITAADVNAESSDNCSIMGLSLDKSVFSCQHIGSNTVKLIVTDGTGNTASATARVTVIDPIAPMIKANQLFDINENSPANTVVGTVSAIDNCSIRSWKIVDGNSANAFAVDASGRISVRNASALDYEVREQFVLKLSATDAADNTSSSLVTIRLKNLNDHAPVLAAIAEVTGNEHELISFTANAQDADGTEELQFKLEGKVPAGATINASTGHFSWKPAEDQDGTHTFTVKVTDGTATAEQQVTVVVREVNQLPVITSVPQTSAVIGEPYTYKITATDADFPANKLSYSAPVVSGWLKFDATTQVLSGTPAIGSEGKHTITIRVSDGAEGINQEFTITVASPTGIEDEKELENEVSVTIYPNPSTGKISIEIADLPAGKIVEAGLFSLEGQKLGSAEGKLEQVSQQLSTQLAGAKAGIYILQLTRDGVATTHKIMKQ